MLASTFRRRRQFSGSWTNSWWGQSDSTHGEPHS